MNKIMFCGRISSDIETRYLPGENATCMANFNMAVDRKYKSKEEGAPTADFFRITVYGKSAEFASKYLSKGLRILVEGRVQNNNYTNKDGQKVFGYQFIAENIEFADGKKSDGTSTSVAKAETNNTANTDWLNVTEDVGELPFG